MRHKPIPFLSLKEFAQLMTCTVRNSDGCLIYQCEWQDPTCPHPNAFQVRGSMFKATRIVWAETFGFTTAALRDLETHEVIHIAECPNTGVHQPLCIEPTHLKLGDITTRIIHMRERSTAYRRPA